MLTLPTCCCPTRSSQVNAFVVPGGKVVVYTGALPVLVPFNEAFRLQFAMPGGKWWCTQVRIAYAYSGQHCRMPIARQEPMGLSAAQMMWLGCFPNLLFPCPQACCAWCRMRMSWRRYWLTSAPTWWRGEQLRLHVDAVGSTRSGHGGRGAQTGEGWALLGAPQWQCPSCKPLQTRWPMDIHRMAVVPCRQHSAQHTRHAALLAGTRRNIPDMFLAGTLCHTADMLQFPPKNRKRKMLRCCLQARGGAHHPNGRAGGGAHGGVLGVWPAAAGGAPHRHLLPAQLAVSCIHCRFASVSLSIRVRFPCPCSIFGSSSSCPSRGELISVLICVACGFLAPSLYLEILSRTLLSAQPAVS